MRRMIWLVLFLTLGMVKAQQPVLYLEFEPTMADQIKKTVASEKAKTMMDIYPPSFAMGVKGMALDLSEDAPIRATLKLDTGTYPSYSSKNDFSFQIWIKTKAGAAMGTPIAGNFNPDEPKKPGWIINTQENGAWSLFLFDGKNSYEYLPTQKKRINDGQWHQLGFSMNASKDEVWIYMDGRNVAIYNLSWFRTTENDLPLVLGGSNAKPEYDGMWNAFNGYIDEVKIWNEYVEADEFARLYGAFRKREKLTTEAAPGKLKVFSWNIWHGGHRFGRHVGLKRVIAIIKNSKADVVNLVETYGSGEEIADSLGYYFYLISSNLSIMSKYPIKETIKKYKPFNHGGVVLDLGNDQELVYFDTWLNYLPDYCSKITEGKVPAERLVKMEAKTREKEIKIILRNIKPYLDKADSVPVIMAGDFNSGSHLDWTEQAKEQHFGYVVKWPVSREMLKAGFKDSFREANFDPVRFPGYTWSPQAYRGSDKYGVLDRIDFIYYCGKSLKVVDSQVVDECPGLFPSDHAAVETVFAFR
jgi:exonuclease III